MNQRITRIVVATVALACACTSSPLANAQSAFFTFSPVSDLSSAQSGTLQFTINLTVSGLSGGAAIQPGAQNIQGLTYFLVQTTPNGGPFPFSITGRDIGGPASPSTWSPFTDLISTQAQVFASPGNNVDANGNERDLGALSDNPMGNGTYFIAKITLSFADDLIARQYTFQTATAGGKAAVFNDSEGDTFPIQPGSISITRLGVPEPSPLALIGITVAALLFAGRLRKLLRKA